ncbi:lysyl-tRNA synthetase [Whalleya microplaca]|nr:lysyl-tRNA synthetase [Whalleya microplaca]
MTRRQCLRFLRPYLCEAPSTRTAAYARFFSATRRDLVFAGRPHCSQLSRSIHNSAARRSDNGSPGAEKDVESHAATINRRIQKLREFDALRYPRLANRPKRMTVPEFRRKYQDVASTPANEEVVLEGRVMAVRRSGSKLVFLSIMNEYEYIQIMISLGQLSYPQPTPFEFKQVTSPFLRGDIVSITGKAVRTGKDELTLTATELPTLLSPAVAPLPVKLINEETMVLKRHVDSLVNRDTLDMFRLRSHVLMFLREFFYKRYFIEVQTPILADRADGATARPFLTSAPQFPHKELALRIAPELWLKRLVVGGNDKVFEIGPTFRNEGLDTTHNPEFTMCEFYCAYANLAELMAMTRSMFAQLFQSSNLLIQRRLQSLYSLRDTLVNTGPWKEVEFIPTLEETLGFKFPDLSAPDALPELTKLLEDHAVNFSSRPPEATLNKLLDELASTHLEAHFRHKPFFVVHHPACMSPLAKSFTCPKTGQLVSARAELFIEGREVANMYEEENDPFEQRRKFRLQAEAKSPTSTLGGDEAQGQDPEIDESYVQALEYGLPPTGGCGFGVDRLVMLISGAPRISDTLAFGNLRNVLALRQAARDAS